MAGPRWTRKTMASVARGRIVAYDNARRNTVGKAAVMRLRRAGLKNRYDFGTSTGSLRRAYVARRDHRYQGTRGLGSRYAARRHSCTGWTHCGRMRTTPRLKLQPKPRTKMSQMRWCQSIP